MSPLNWLSIFLSIIMLCFLLMVWWNFSYSYLTEKKLILINLEGKKWVW